MRSGSRILALAWLLLSACSSNGSDTKIMVVVWSDLAVPTEMDTIRVDVSGSSPSPSTTFDLTTGGTKLPVVMELVSPDNKGVAFAVVATGLLNTTPVVAHAANLFFDPGHTRVLMLRLDHACKGATSGPCTQPIDVNVNNLPEYDPAKPFTAPDGSSSPQSAPDGSRAETGSIDLVAEARPMDDAAPDTQDAPQSVDAAADNLVPDAGTEMPADAPLGFEASPDAPSDPGIPDNVVVFRDGAVVDGAVDSVPVLDTGSEARGETPDTRDASSDPPADLTAPADSGRDLEVPDSASACVLPMTTCTGVCIDPQTSIGNCGGCGRACGSQNGTPTCSASACSMVSCSPGFLNCSADENTSRDGCETNGNTDSAHCGRCGNPCTSKVCRNQTCLATARYGNTGPGTDISAFTQDFLAGIQIYIPNASVVTGLGAVLYDATGSCNMYLGLYQDVAGNPGKLIATVTVPALVAPGGKELSVAPPVDVPAGTYWILGVWDKLASFATNSTTTTVIWRSAAYPYGALPSTAPLTMTPISAAPPNLYVIVAQ
jgi:hypothetical protein